MLARRHHRVSGLVHEQRRAHVVDLGPRLDDARADVDDRLDDAVLGPGNDDGPHAALDGIARLPRAEHLLVRLVQHDAREQCVVAEPAAVAQHRDRPRDLFAGQHL